MASGPLAHLRVVDLTDIRGAMAARLLGDLGADVVKVEPPEGDPGRGRGPFAGDVPDPDRALAFLYRNANKRGLRLDLATPAGRRELGALCTNADVLIENLGADGEARLGLTPDRVHAEHPHLVHVAIADCGLSGPRASWRLEALPAFAASGALFASGFPELPPCWLPGYLAHDSASLFAVVGALAAVLDRARHGRGQTVEVSVQEAGINALHPWSIPTADYARVYPSLPRLSVRNGAGAYTVLPAADGYIRALPASPRQWRAFVELVGVDALAGPEWERSVYRLANADVIRLLTEDALRGETRAQVHARARELDVPLVPLNRPEEFVLEQQTRHRRYFRPSGFPHLGDAPFASPPFNLSATPASVRRPAPVAGAAEGGFAPRTAEPSAGGTGPALAGLRVVDLGVGVAGPEVGYLLAELGAEVVKIESRANVDFLRRVTVEADAPDRSWTFNDASRGQRSVCLDLRTPRGRALALEICARADVVIENNRGGVAARWGLDYEDVRARRPDVIYYASQAFGRGGPLGEASAFGPLNSAFSGVTWLWNHPNAPYPAGCALNHPDHTAAKLATGVILAALEHRRRTGEGQRIEMSQAESAAYLMGEVYLQEACTGRRMEQVGNAAPYAAPHGVYPCAGTDRWVAIAIVSDDEWRRLRAALGWSDEPVLRTLEGRSAARATLDERLAAWTRERSAEDAAAHLQAAGVSAMPVQNGDDHRADVHLAARGAIVTVEHPEIGSERHSGNPIRPSLTPLTPAGRAPLLGEHTEDVLVRWLALSPDEARALVAEAVCR
ncbi:MAG TPA: CoA transferase [Candidatus Eisenbacteria bacterium]|nr:CoA transferase [Candidatus Eisenbacteria bacterium]